MLNHLVSDSMHIVYWSWQNNMLTPKRVSPGNVCLTTTLFLRPRAFGSFISQPTVAESANIRVWILGQLTHDLYLPLSAAMGNIC